MRDQLESIECGDARVREVVERELAFADDQQVKFVLRFAQRVEKKRDAFFCFEVAEKTERSRHPERSRGTWGGGRRAARAPRSLDYARDDGGPCAIAIRRLPEIEIDAVRDDARLESVVQRGDLLRVLAGHRADRGGAAQRVIEHRLASRV